MRLSTVFGEIDLKLYFLIFLKLNEKNVVIENTWLLLQRFRLLSKRFPHNRRTEDISVVQVSSSIQLDKIIPVFVFVFWFSGAFDIQIELDAVFFGKVVILVLFHKDIRVYFERHKT